MWIHKLGFHAMKTRSNPELYHYASEVFYWPVGAAGEWHLSSECAHTPCRCEFIWFDMWCAAHVFTGACVVEPRAWFLLSLANTRPWLSRTSFGEQTEERCPSSPFGSSLFEIVISLDLTNLSPLNEYFQLSLYDFEWKWFAFMSDIILNTISMMLLCTVLSVCRTQQHSLTLVLIVTKPICDLTLLGQCGN